MLTKQSSLNDLMNAVSIRWFKLITTERGKQLLNEFQQLNAQIPLMGEQFNNINNEVTTQVEKTKNEIFYLENIGQIKNYSKTNAFDASTSFFQNNNFSFKNISEFLQKGESISQVLVKIQLGETFKIVEELLSKIEILNTKIGSHELIEKISSDDVDYLLSKVLETYTNDITKFIAQNREDIDNVMTECNQILNNKDWNEKLKNADIVSRYFKKFKMNSLFSNFVSPQDLENENTKKEIIEYSKVLVTLNSMIYLIKFNNLFKETLNSIK